MYIGKHTAQALLLAQSLRRPFSSQEVEQAK